MDINDSEKTKIKRLKNLSLLIDASTIIELILVLCLLIVSINHHTVQHLIGFILAVSLIILISFISIIIFSTKGIKLQIKSNIIVWKILMFLVLISLIGWSLWLWNKSFYDENIWKSKQVLFVILILILAVPILAFFVPAFLSFSSFEYRKYYENDWSQDWSTSSPLNQCKSYILNLNCNKNTRASNNLQREFHIHFTSANRIFDQLIFDCFYRTYHYENKIGPKNDAGPLTKRKIAKLDKIKSLREFDKSLILFVYGVANTIILFFIENSISSILAPLDISEGTTKMILIFAPILIDLILLFVLVIKTFSRFMKIENITKNLPIFMSFWRHDKIYNKKCTASINLIVDRYYPVDLFRKELETIRMKWESNGINWWFSIIFQINKNNKKILNLINEIYAPRDVLQQLNK